MGPRQSCLDILKVCRHDVGHLPVQKTCYCECVRVHKDVPVRQAPCTRTGRSQPFGPVLGQWCSRLASKDEARPSWEHDNTNDAWDTGAQNGADKHGHVDGRRRMGEKLACNIGNGRPWQQREARERSPSLLRKLNWLLRALIV